MNSVMYGQSHVSAALLIFYTCILLPYRELKHYVWRILGSIFDQLCPRDKILSQPNASFKFPTLMFRDLQDGVRKLPKERRCRDNTWYAGDGCAICLMGYEEDDVVSELNRCGHVFHLHCIETWVDHRFQFTCPLCRSFIF